MCDGGISAAAMMMAAVTSASSMATSYIQTQKQNNIASATADAANTAAAADNANLDIKQQQENEQFTQQAVARQLQGMRERSALMVSSSDAGIGGITPIREQANSMLQQAWDTGIEQQNYENGVNAITGERASVRATQVGRVNQADAQTTSPFMAGLQIVGAGVSGGMSGLAAGKSLTSTTTNPVAKS